MTPITWAERDHGSIFDNAECGACGRRVYLHGVDIKCYGCGEPAPQGCLCQDVRVVA